MELIIQIIGLATAVVSLVSTIVKAISVARGERPKLKGGRKR
ncbi:MULTISPECIES: hypothetical protein [unclassified Adlercreutzia]|nr:MULTISPECIES: hypothetical protein [unclassified Adlercreutzia]